MGWPDINYLEMAKPSEGLEKPNNSGELTVVNTNSNSEFKCRVDSSNWYIFFTKIKLIHWLDFDVDILL